MNRGFKTELDPNNKQTTLLRQNAGAARFAYNWGLDRITHRISKPNAMQLHRELNALKSSHFPWMYDCSKCSMQEGLRNLETAFKNFFDKCKKKKQGKFKGKVGFPQKKTRRKGIGSFRLTGTIKVYEDRIQLPRLGIIKLKERDYLPTEAKILSATISEKAGHWFVSVQVDIPQPKPAPKPKAVVGVDLGIKTLAVCSDGKTYENPKALKKNLRKLKRLQRCVSRRKKGSQNRKKAVAKVARLHYHIANIRKDTLHKITSELTKTKSTIVIEDLNVSGMLRNHCLAQAISDIGLFEFRRQLSYKSDWYGCIIKVADRFYPSSKTCSVCGCINDELTLADREWTCCCGAKHDRDFNAACNLEILAASSADSQNACGEGSSGDRSVTIVKLAS